MVLPVFAFLFSCGSSTDSSESLNTFEEVTLVQSEIVPTVFTITWETTTPVASFVEYGPDEGETWTTPADEPGTSHEATLLGLAPSAPFSWRLVASDNAGQVTSDWQDAQTGSLDTNLPTPILSVDEEASAGGWFLGALRGPTTNWAVILNEQGEVVWAYDVELWVLNRVRMAVDHKAILIQDTEVVDDREVVIRRINFEGEVEAEVTATGTYTDFDEVEPGVYASFGFDVRDFDTPDGVRRILGGTLVELTADGTRKEIWNSFDHFVPDLSVTYATGMDLDDPTAEDWVHLNHLDFVPEEQAYYITSRILGAGFKIDRASGEMVWSLGGPGSDFTSSTESSILVQPHSIMPIDGGVSMFEYQDESSDGCSAAVDIRLDGTSAEQVWTYSTETCMMNGYLGCAQALDNGNRQLVLSLLGQIDEVRPDKTLVWRLNLPFDASFGYVQRLTSLY